MFGNECEHNANKNATTFQRDYNTQRMHIELKLIFFMMSSHSIALIVKLLFVTRTCNYYLSILASIPNLKPTICNDKKDNPKLTIFY